MIPGWVAGFVAEHGPMGAVLRDRVAAAAAELPAPERAWMDVRALVAGDPAAVSVLTTHPQGVEIIVRLGAFSRWAMGALFADGSRLTVLLTDIKAHTAAAAVATDLGLELEIDKALSQAESIARGIKQARQVLAQHRIRHQLRIIVADIMGHYGFERVVAELSALADSLINAGLRLARLSVATPSFDPGSFVVCAFGKLGGRELNYSSDVDLMFVYEAAPGGVDPHAYWVAVSMHLIRLLEHPNEALMLRVDMRLRPEGDAGELCLSLEETINYYYSVGRPWERQALIKMRCQAGSRELGHRLVAGLTPWIYPQEPRWDELEESRTMRRRIEERAVEANLKTAAGGIRDVEFLVQYFQLLYGGQDVLLRGGHSLEGLRRLRDRGVLPRSDARDLELAYIRLRTLEHHLQMWEDQQIHVIPSDPEERRSFAWRCGAASVEAFDKEVATLRTRVRVLAERHFLDQSPEAEAWLHMLLQDGDIPQGALPALAGFRSTQLAVTRLRELAREPFFLIYRDRTERAVMRLAPLLLPRLGLTPDPDSALTNFVRVAAAVGGRATFLTTLVEDPRQLALVVDLCGHTGFLVQLLIDNPGLADALAENALDPTPTHGITLLREARMVIHGLDDPGPALRFIWAREQLGAALRDLRPGQFVSNATQSLGEQLTAATYACCEALWLHVVQERARAWGVPFADGRPVRAAVLALGKTGGAELGYRSDLDLIIVRDPGGQCPKVDKDGDAFWTRVAQDWIRILTENGLAEIDLRLRPWGEQGPLVIPIDMLEAYWQDERDLWERLAMVRVRPFCGDPELGREAADLILRPTVHARLPSDGAAQVLAMRHRLEMTVQGQDDVKRGPGGYVDIEFACQWAILQHAGSQPLPSPLSTQRILSWLTEKNLVDATLVNNSRQSLETLRRIEGRIRLRCDGPITSAIPSEPTARKALALHCGLDEATLQQHVDNARFHARAFLTQVVGPPR